MIHSPFFSVQLKKSSFILDISLRWWKTISGHVLNLNNALLRMKIPQNHYTVWYVHCLIPPKKLVAFNDPCKKLHDLEVGQILVIPDHEHRILAWRGWLAVTRRVHKLVQGPRKKWSALKVFQASCFSMLSTSKKQSDLSWSITFKESTKMCGQFLTRKPVECWGSQEKKSMIRYH